MGGPESEYPPIPLGLLMSALHIDAMCSDRFNR